MHFEGNGQLLGEFWGNPIVGGAGMEANWRKATSYPDTFLPQVDVVLFPFLAPFLLLFGRTAGGEGEKHFRNTL